MLFGGGPLLSSLWAEYLFDTGNGTVLVDSSSNGRNLTLGFSGPSSERPTWGVVGGIQCLTFDEALLQQIGGTGIASLSQPFTIAALVRFSGSGLSGIIAGNGSYLYSTYVNGTTMTIRFPTAQAVGSLAADSTWRSIVFGVDGANSWSAVDGSATTVAATPGNNDLVNDGNLSIGSVYRGSGPWGGQIGYVSVVPRFLAATHSQALHLEIMAKRDM